MAVIATDVGTTSVRWMCQCLHFLFVGLESV